MNRLSVLLGRVLSTTRVLSVHPVGVGVGCGCGTWVVGGDGRVVAHCWVLKDQAGSHRWVGACVVASVLPFVLVPPVGGVGGLVGLLFEIWIVDASICCCWF